MSRFLLLLLTGTLAFTGLHAQQASFKGRVLDANKKEALDFATVTLQSLNDSTKLYGAKSKSNGSFNIDNVPYGQYKLSVTSIGYQPKITTKYKLDKPQVDAGNLELKPSNTNLKAVNIVGEKNAIEMGIDKKVFNVDKNITSAGGTATDLLKNVPSVNVDMDGNVSIRGKDNVTLLVDGKPSAIFGTDPQTALQSIPASSIESIEVITNPSSKYEAQGMSGILNIILKKDRKEGYNAMINAGYANPYRLNGGINFNANVHRWNFFFNGNVRQSRTWEETTNNRKDYSDTHTYYSYLHNDRKPLNGFINLGAEYNFGKYDKITLSENIFNAKMRGFSQTTIETLEPDAPYPLSRLLRDNHYIGNPLSSTTNLQFKHGFKKPKEELNAELNFSDMRYLRSSSFQTNIFDSSNNQTLSYSQSNPVHGGNWNATFQVDYTRPFAKNARLDLGEKTYYIRFHSQNFPTKQLPGQPEQEESALKNHFTYTQQVHGVYGNFADQWGATGMQLGLRGEYFSYNGFVYQYNAPVKNDYLSFFPTLFLTHKLSAKEDLNFNYARRVNRPGFMQLIPYIDVSNPQDTSQGNPNLKPEFINAFEAGYTYTYGKNNTFLVSAYYQLTNDLIQRYRRFNPDGTTFSQNRNLASGETFGAELTNRVNFLSWWDASLNLNVFHNNINGKNLDPTLSRSGYGGFAKLMTNTRFLYGFSTQVTANYFARTVVAQGQVDPYENVDIALKKSFMKNFATLTLTCNDIFNTLHTQTHYNLYPYYDQIVLRKNQTRSISINLQVKLASKSQRNNPDAMKKMMQMKKEKDGNKDGKEGKSRDENLKKDEGGGEDNGGSKEGKEGGREGGGNK